MNEPIYFDEVAQSLSKSVYHAQANLKNVLGLLNMVIVSGMWRRRMVVVTGEVVEFTRFEDFVAAKPPEGLGSSIETLKWLCNADADMLSLIDQASNLAPIPINISLEKVANKPKTKRFSLEWTIEKLTEENRPDLIRELVAKRLTPYAVQVELGWRKSAKK